MRSDQAKTISIPQYLEIVEGIHPSAIKQNGRELWYRSPIRANDSTPSFKVDTERNLWYDHGLGCGGNILDLVTSIRNASVSEALSILDGSGLYHGGYAPPRISRGAKSSLFEHATKAQNYSAGEKIKSPDRASCQILDVKELTHPALLEYLDTRCIPLDIARQYLKEVHFKQVNELAVYYALGWPVGNGFELRNKYFKGVAGTGKEISALNLQTDGDLVIFEGFMDFLSYLTWLRQEKDVNHFNVSTIILNSVSLRTHAAAIVERHRFRKIYLFLDNDDAGRDTMDYFEQALENTHIINKSDLYAGYKDFNDMIRNKK